MCTSLGLLILDALNAGTEMYLRGRASAHGAMGHRINPSWWTH